MLNLSCCFQAARCDTSSSEVLHQLLCSLATPPRLTTLRVNTLKYDRETVIKMLKEIVDKVTSIASSACANKFGSM